MTDLTPDARFARGFHQGLFDSVTSLDEAILSALSALERKDGPAVAEEIMDLLSGKINDEELLAIWNKQSTDVYFTNPQGLRRLLKRAIELIRDHPYFQEP